MRRLVLAVLFGFVPWTASAQGSVTLSVCNAGKVDVDVFLSRAGKVSGAHIGPADCATIAEGTGAMAPAYLGFAFVDSQGRWGAAKRFDVDNYRTGPDGMKQASQSALVRRGTTNVSLPMQWLFSPRAPGCVSTGTTVPDNGRIIVGPTYCDQLRFDVTVEAFPESREIGFRRDCDPCDQKAFPQLTAEQRAIKQSQREAARIRDARVSTASPNLMGILNKNMTVVDVAEVGERLERLKPPQRVNWSELLLALKVAGSGRVWDVIPRYIVIRGTVSNVVMLQGPTDRQVNVFFRESPPVADARPQFAIPEFGVCTTNPDILQDVFGKDFLTSMAGKTIEVQGETWGGGNCGSLKAAVPISLARQIRLVQAASGSQSAPVSEAPVVPQTISGSFADFTPAWIGKLVTTATGTISRAEAKGGWVSFYFEGAGDQLAVCMPEPVVQDFIGDNPPSRLVGEVVRARGVVRKPQRCGGRTAEIESGVEFLRTRDVMGELGGGIPAR
jgi:hypothetical protein